MKKTKKIIIATLAMASVAWASYTFAASGSWKLNNIKNQAGKMFNMEGKHFRWWQWDSWTWSEEKRQELGQFIDYSKLTDAQKTEIQKLQEDKKAKMLELQKSYLASMKAYVSADKQTQFDEFVSKIGTEDFDWMWKWWPRGEMKWWILFNQFIDQTKLTDTQKTELKTLQDKNRTQMEEILTKLKASTTDAEKATLKTQMETLQKSFFASLRTYISSDKLTQFDEFVSKIGTMPKLKWNFGQELPKADNSWN